MSQCTTTRRALSKKTRFTVFERDDFTCQYCGKQPPDVILHVDHIEPVSLGGTNELDNLITSCQDCNLGKSDRRLGEVSPRPDANAMLARAAQEVAEVIAYRSALADKCEEHDRLCEDFEALWYDLAGDAKWCPSYSVLMEAIDKCNGEYSVVESALRGTASKESSGELDRRYWVKFFWGCFWAAKRDAE